MVSALETDFPNARSGNKRTSIPSYGRRQSLDICWIRIRRWSKWPFSLWFPQLPHLQFEKPSLYSLKQAHSTQSLRSVGLLFLLHLCLSFDGTIIVLVAEVSNLGPYTFSLLISSFAILSSGPVPSIVLAVIPWPPLGMWPSLSYHLSHSRTWPHLGSWYYSESSSSNSMIAGTHWENSLLRLYCLHVPLRQLILIFFFSLEACEINCFDSFLLF